MLILSKKLLKFLLTTGVILLMSSVFSQKVNDIEVRNLNNDILKYPWAGGLNAPQFSEIDLNNDGIMDLFVFDRDGGRVLTFINGGTSGKVDYFYAPEYENYFPKMSNWVLLVDYNNDGLNDIFTYNSAGIMVYKNTSSSGNLSFMAVVSPYLTSNAGGSTPASNIYVNPVDIPAIADIDFDGDIDILSFGINSDQLTFYENFAADSNDIEDFKFHDNTYCWGNIREAAFTNKVSLNQGCPKIMAKAKGNKHAGATILAFDPDGDSDMDILLGDPTFSNIVFLENGGNKNFSNIIDQDTLFPSYNTSVDLRLFPAAYYLDVNNDGLKDLLFAPNTSIGSENYEGVLYYKNLGNSSGAIFSLEEKGFLQNSMIDLGSYAYPVLFDYNEDGLLDLVVGNGGYYNGINQSIHTLALFENTGSFNAPKFKLVDKDFAGISEIKLNTTINTTTRNIIPAFSDINKFGKSDLFVGDFQGNVHYFQNYGGPGASDFKLTEANYKSIDIGSHASPFIIDLDEDGLGDLVFGKQNGKISYFKNIGTTNYANFETEAVTDNLGGVNTKPWYEYDGYSQAKFYRADGELYLISGSISGQLFRYGNIKGNLNGSFTVLDTLFENIDVGNRAHVEIGDLDNDGKFDLIIGNSGGGLTFYRTDVLVSIKEESKINSNKLEFRILNTGSKEIILESDYSGIGEVFVYNMVGQEIFNNRFDQKITLDFNHLSNGVYLIKLELNGNTATKKYILSK